MTPDGVSRRRCRGAAWWLVLGAWSVTVAASFPLVSERGTVPIVLAGDASGAERTAAEELALYLGKLTGEPFRIVEDASTPLPPPTIEVGATRAARESGADPGSMGDEAWSIRTDSGRLFLFGGRPRGTLYAVYHFLEDHAGVRWWTPFEEFVPRRTGFVVPAIDRGGEPAFVYRDVHGIDGPRQFCARNRMNGEFARLPADYGGVEGYGPPTPSHTFYKYFPPHEYFKSRPEYFSEIAGLRYGGDGQLCLTNPDLLEKTVVKLERFIELSRAAAAERGERPPRLFNISHNDWGRACTCDACSAIVEREGGQAGPLIHFVNGVAERIAKRHPDVLVDTLAYSFAVDPPRELAPRDNVTVRLSDLYQRDFSRPVTDPVNRHYAEVLQRWAARTRHMRIWDYSVAFTEEGELPLPNARGLARDFALYLDKGVEGVFIQHDFPIDGDFHDLKAWLILKLLEDPRADPKRLLREFTAGYYGPAARTIRRYLAELERAAGRKPSHIGYPSGPEAYAYLDLRFTTRAHKLFDRAERKAAGDSVLLRRLRHARLSLDRATILRWDLLAAESPAGAPWNRREILERYRDTVMQQIEFRIPDARQRQERSAELEERIAGWGGKAVE